MARIKFEELTKAEQRVVIAKDLIARLKANEFIAKSNTYLRSPELRGTIENTKELRDVLSGTVCTGCEIGGLFLCAVDRFNALKLRDAGDLIGKSFSGNNYRMEAYLQQWFPAQTLAAVERAFEGWGRWEKWAEKRTPEQRMRQISQNIIKNKGKFIGSQLTRT